MRNGRNYALELLNIDKCLFGAARRPIALHFMSSLPLDSPGVMLTTIYSYRLFLTHLKVEFSDVLKYFSFSCTQGKFSCKTINELLLLFLIMVLLGNLVVAYGWSER